MAETQNWPASAETEAACKARLLHAALEEEKAIQRGFEPFTWLHATAQEKHGPDVVEAFNLARNIVHGNAALLEVIEDQGFSGDARKAFGVGREGDLIRFLVAANQLAGHRLGDLCDNINDGANGEQRGARRRAGDPSPANA